MSSASVYDRDPSEEVLTQLRQIATKLRVDSIKSTNAAKSGHPTSCASVADIMAVLYWHTMKHNPMDPRDPNNDRFILSKGHAAPILYSVMAELGFVKESELENLRKIDCELEGHPTPRLAFVDVATGSLGQGLSCAAGIAYGGKYLDKASFRTFCVMGDGESAEGSVWEAMHFASHYKLNNLIACIDVNRLGQSEPTSLGHDMDTYKRRCEAFGWKTHVVDGHDIKQLVQVFYDARRSEDKPVMILAKTFKGKGLVGIENEDNWHGKALGDKADKIIQNLQESIKGLPAVTLVPERPAKAELQVVSTTKVVLSDKPEYEIGKQIATRQAYGTALVKLATVYPRIIALDCDVKNSTYSENLKKVYPQRFVECFIAEQNAIGVAIGLATRHRFIPFMSTFACFMTRGFDQLRMGAISLANVKFVGSHAGVSIGEDGPSQMALEDIAMFRSLPGCTVFYPSDAVSTERACELAANTEGICFIRTGRPANAVIFKGDEVFEVGKAKVIKQSETDVVTVIGAGVTLHEAIKAAEQLAGKGVNIRVLDPFTIKPIDAEAIVKHARATKGRVISVEDHYPEGGIGEAVAGVIAQYPDIVLKRLHVNRIPHSGPPNVLLDLFEISAKAIVAAVESEWSNKA
ncbi:Transketolase-like protein 2 [Hypsibius exemplaris]|uniref:transketolase n=1 Tax=Hypsibius exemplaris TaxID=2072580 RepID=A0A1W0WWS3_HYPEX|nr:Transketolase-like protein 2 [Hypsibius exemplaris]